MSLGHATIVTLGTALPPALGVFGRLEVLLRRPDTGLDDIVNLVRIDPGLTFQLIKLANSALFGLRSRCDSLEEAVARVGFGDIHQLVGLAVSRGTFQRALDQYDIACGRLWENSVATGLLAAELAGAAGADTRSAYATGLLRPLGRVVLNNSLGAVRYPGAPDAPDVHAWERATYGLSAADASAILLDHWRFAPEAVSAVRRHRAPDGAGAARLHLAARLAEAWGCGLPGEAAGWRDDDDLLALAAVPREAVEPAAACARKKFSACAQIEWSQAA